jgi:type I restriction enzyme S subunit
MSFPRYPAYKPSGVEWLGEVPEHWEVIRLKNVLRCRITDGPHTTPEFIEEGIPFLSVDGIQDGELRFEGCRYISAEDHEEFSRKARPARDDILMGKAASTGKIARVKTDLAFSIWSPLALIRVETRLSSPSYYEQFLKSISSQAQIDVLCTSNTQKNISMDDIPKLIVARPPLEEQLRIATFLDRETAKIDALIAEQQRLIELLQEKRQAVISHAVTKGLNPEAPMKDSGVEWLGEVPEHWIVTQLRHFTKSLPGFAFSSEGFIQDESKWKLLRGVNVGVSCIRWDDTLYWDRQVDDRLDQYVLSPGDLVVGLDRPMIKEGLRVARIAQEDCPCMLLQRVAAVKDSKDLSNDYLFFLLSSPYFLAHFEPETTGVSVPHISTGQIDSFVVPIPPPKEQAEVVAFLSVELKAIQRLTEESSRSISLLQERRSALISAAVTGQIDVRGLVAEVNAD